MTNPVHKLADGIRSLMNRGKDQNPYLEDDGFFADELDLEEPSEPSKPAEPVEDLLEDEPKPKKKGFHLPSFHKNNKEVEVKPLKPSKPSKASPADARKKKRILFGCTVLVLAGGFTYAYFFMDDGLTGTTPPQTSTIATTNQKKPAAEKKDNAQQAPQPAVSLANPFVDVSLLKKTGVNADGTLPTMSSAAPVPARSLPSIPSAEYPRYSENPRPSLPAIPSMGSLPAVPNANIPGEEPQEAPAARPNEVQGVITGADGQNMAIMGDGTIVSEGETYNDGRIAYIGGDGITFNDGSTLDYK